MQTDQLTGYLPSELVLDIFKRLLVPATRSRWTEYSPPTTTFTPFSLGAICRSWRHITWAAPELWSTLTLTLSPEHYRGQVSLLRQWLDRNGTGLLSIAVRGQGGEADQHWELHPPSEIFQQLAAVSDRWQHVDMFLPYPCYPDLFSIQGHLPRLKSLMIRPPDDVDPLFNYKLDFFRDAPQLRDLWLSGVYFSDATMLPWGQLLCLSVQDFCVDDCYTMLQSAPSLTACRFDSVHQPSDFAYPSQDPIHLAQLHTLEINSTGNMVTTAFLHSLEIPSLKDLDISLGFSFDDRQSFSMSSLTSLIGRSGCAANLRRLAIRNIRLVEQELVDCLACAPALVELRLHVEYPKSCGGMFISDTFLAALSPPSMRRPETAAVLPFDRPLLPALQVLEYNGPVHFTGHAIQLMFEYRWAKAPTRLQAVTIESTSAVDLSHEVQGALLRIASEGMDLHLSNGCVPWFHDTSNLSVVAASHTVTAEADSARSSTPPPPPSLPASPLLGYQQEVCGLPKLLFSRRSQTGQRPPRRPLTNSPSKPGNGFYSPAL